MTDKMKSKEDPLIPALRYHWLTSMFDPVLRITMREQTFKSRLIEQARIQPGHRVLDLGCGTATLAIMMKRLHQNADVIGLDGDENVLNIARDKIARNGLQINLNRAMSYMMPYHNATFHRVVSSLVFHHLSRENKILTLQEAYRILQPGGELHIADFGKSSNTWMRSAFFIAQLFEGFLTTTDNVKGMLPVFMKQAGFSDVEETYRMATIYGTLSFYKGKKKGAISR